MQLKLNMDARRDILCFSSDDKPYRMFNLRARGALNMMS